MSELEKVIPWVKGHTIDPQRIAKIERNYAFVADLLSTLSAIEHDAMYADAGKQAGLRQACERIRKVIDKHVE